MKGILEINDIVLSLFSGNENMYAENMCTVRLTSNLGGETIP